MEVVAHNGEESESIRLIIGILRFPVLSLIYIIYSHVRIVFRVHLGWMGIELLCRFQNAFRHFSPLRVIANECTYLRNTRFAHSGRFLCRSTSTCFVRLRAAFLSW